MNECVFCKIAKGEIPAGAGKLYEDDNFIAFLDIKPNNPGHALVVPKNHYENIYNVPDEVLKNIAPIVKKMTVAVKNGVNADGINIIMNNDGAAGQIVPHAHFHIIPRFADDGLRHWIGKPYPNKEASTKVAEKIKNSF